MKGKCANVKGRTIFDAVMEYTKLYNIRGLMTTFDFKKAFDSLSWKYLFNTLKAFNFGDSFIYWIKVLYSHISSCIMNNGFASDFLMLREEFDREILFHHTCSLLLLKSPIYLSAKTMASKESKWENMR